MPTKFSAYLTIYNDWEFLEPALRSIAPYVDELVVVDGAYEWMAPYLSAMGHDLQRSDQRVYDIVAACGIPHRVITGVWAHQIEKRIAGYEACTGRYVCRIDSDEILFCDERELERFFRCGGAVGQVEMPTYIAPGWIKSHPPRPPPRGRRAKLRAFFRPRKPRRARQSFLFDRNRINADIHLNYLWIVRDSDKRLHPKEKPFDLYPQPIGFNAHLTIWRSVPASIQRAESYVLHHVLRNGAPWLPQLKGQPMADLKTLFDIVPPQIFREIVAASRLGINNMLGSQIFLAPSPLTSKQEAIFSGDYEDLLSSHAKLNRQMAETGLHFTPDMPPVIDISNADCIDAVAPDGVLLAEFDSDVLSANVQIRSLIPRPPWQTLSALEPGLRGCLLAVRVPPPEGGATLRREIELNVRTKSTSAVQRFKIRCDRPLPPDIF